MIRLLATDIDHTVFDAGAGAISTRNRQAIRALLQHGICVVLASSRVMFSMRQLAQELGLSGHNGYLIANNGAQIVHTEMGTVMQDIPFDRQDLAQLYDAAKQYDAAFSICQDDYTLCSRYTQSLAYDFEHVGIDLYVVHDLLKQVRRPCYHCSYTGDDGIMRMLQKELSARFAQYHFNIPQPGYLDVSLAGINKGSALRLIQTDAGITAAETAAIGDGENDIPLFASAGLSAAVGNAAAEVRAAATVTTASCAEDGFAAFVERYILEETI